MSTNRSDASLIVLGSLLYTAGSAILYVLPAYLTELSVQLHIDAVQLGSISAAENLGIALASILGMVWLTRVNRQLLAVFGVGCCVGLNLVAFFTRTFDQLIAVRFLTGLLGEGILFALAFVVLGATRNPDRSFGIGLTIVVTFGSLVLGSSTYLDHVPVGTGVLLPLAIIPLGILIAINWMPRGSPAAPCSVGRPGAQRTGRRMAMLAVAGMAVWFAAPGAFWTFADTAASAHQVRGETISIALAIGNTVGLVGGLAAAWQGNRWGRLGPAVVSTVGLCLSVLGFEHSRTVASLATALAAFNVFWNYGAVYQMGLVVALDPDGRASLAISAAQVLGFAAGGFFAGVAIVKSGYAVLPIVVVGFAVSGVLALAPCFRAPKLKPHSG
jgi:predicted MFS family arabinose efflux permease